MKEFLILFFSKYKLVRKFIGGRWVVDKYGPGKWVQWNDLEDCDDSIGLTWPPSEYCPEFICEEYPSKGAS